MIRKYQKYKMKLPFKLTDSSLKSLRQTQDQILNLQTQANLILQGDKRLKETIIEMSGLDASISYDFDLQKGEIIEAKK